MKKVLLVLSLLFLCSCTNREDYYVFSFDDFSITPGYDDVNYMKIAFEMELPETLNPYEELKDVDFYFWDKHYGSVDIINDTNKQIETIDGSISKLTIYFNILGDHIYKIDETVLKSSVKENCEMFEGEYISRNGYACAFGKNVHGKKNVVVLYGDILAMDQDELSHMEIYVEE